MYSLEKSVRGGERLRRNPPNPQFPSTHPSFSSTLLDEIYRSIDDVNEKCDESKLYKNRVSKKQGNGGGVKAKKPSNCVEDEETARFRRACLIGNNKGSALRRESDRKSQYNEDPLFFSSSSSSSESSSGGFSSSDTESSWKTKSRTSCFTAIRPKPEKLGKKSNNNQNAHHMLNEMPQGRKEEAFKDEDGLVKSKLRALKIYNNLKKVKQPISPGGKLASFLNSLFTNGNTKQTKTKKDSSSFNAGYEDDCSSVTSYSRSCLTKTMLNTKEKPNNGVKRTVRFCPVSVIVDEDCHPCGHKSICEDKVGKFGLRLDELKKNSRIFGEKSPKIEDEEDDAVSDSSSDLFELDHLAFPRNDNRYREDLPVYETTRLDMNRAIANGLVR